ncbi:MAG: hypothetical protein ACI857_002150 [Arenicella sp.]|jgi:hypothetical protein
MVGILTLATFSFNGYSQSFDGYALYNLQNQNTTYLIDKDGLIAHSWSCAVSCNYSVLLKDNGNIMRGGVYSGNQLNGAAVGGMVQEIDPDGNIVWEYIYSDADHASHHDITLLPNGNVLLTAWEVKSTAELTQAGVDNPTTEQWPTHFIELQQDGTSAQIVWEWHMWDHMVQDYDNSKDNFGVISDHPELMDINLLTVSSGGPGPSGGDWFHVNGIDYNEDLDQIVFSSRFLSEIIIIDHSTNITEAAAHSGGNSGMGGDFIFRWGNPSNFGSTDPQTIDEAVHDPRWIDADRPNGGYIQFFNNEGGSGGNSAVDAINPPVNGYNYTMTGTSYGPSNYDWRHDCIVNSTGQSASNRMSNGNTFVNVSQQYMYEVDDQDNIVWQYNAGPTKAFRYECDHPGVAALLGADPCGLVSTEAIDYDISIYPNPSNGQINIKGISTLDSKVEIRVLDIQGNVILIAENVDVINLDNQAEGLYFISVILDDIEILKKKISIHR